MRLLMFFMLAGCLQVSARGVAQSITLREKNASLESVLNSIKQQSGYVFFYNYRILEKSKPVTVQVSGVSLKDALDACFKDQPLSYSIEGKLVTVKMKEKPPAIEEEKLASRVIISGTVRDSLGRPLSDITVTLKGKGRSVRTDKNGRFNIEADAGDVLVFSSVSFVPKQITISTSNTEIVVKMDPKIDKLDDVEVVPTGYQFLKRSQIVGATNTIKASELYFNGINTLEQSLQGKLPGLTITNENGGLVGVRQKTRVRGTATLFGNQDPIWVVDGIIQQDPLPFKATTLNSLGGINKDNFDYVRDYVGNAISWLNPQDIDDITVLKDAAATAIYGVRAGNGVIVITTKKGKTGPATINYSVNASMSEKVNYDKLNLMNSKDRVAVSREAFERGLVSATNYNTRIGYAGALYDYLFKNIDYNEFNRRVKVAETANTDWFDLLFRNPFTMNHNLSIGGGNSNTRYYASLSYSDVKGTAIGNDSKAYTGNLSVTSNLSDKLNVGIRLSAAQRNTTGFFRVNPYAYAASTNRAIPAYDANGNRYFYVNTLNGSNGYSFNMEDELDNTGANSRTLSANTNIQVNYNVTRNITFQTMFSYSISNATGASYAAEKSNYIDSIRGFDYGTATIADAAYINSKLPSGGEYNQNYSQSTALNWRNGLSFAKVFNSKHAVTALFGEEINSTKYTGFTETAYGWLRDRGNTFAQVPLTYTTANTPNDLFSKSMPRTITDNVVNNMGAYLTAGYTYDNRYVLNMSVRADASNKFGQDTRQKFNPVWAGGVRWNVGNEKWFDKNAEWINNLSVKASFGYQRNLASNFSPYLIAKIPSSNFASNVVDQFTGEYLLNISNLPYTDLRWEKNTTINLGASMGLFRNRIQASVEYYQKIGKDLITYLVLPEEYGLETMPVNGGSLNNRGLELALSFVPVRTKDFSWSVSTSFSKNFNEIKKTNTAQSLTWRTATSGGLYHEGYPVSGFWAFDFQGINPANGYPVINLATKAGSDTTNDPTSFMKYMGKMDADIATGINMTFRYKRLTLTTDFYAQLGGKKFLSPAYKLTAYLPSEFDNLSKELLDRWTPDNTTAPFPGLPDKNVLASVVKGPQGKINANAYEMYNYSSARVVNASTLRCNSINVSYTLPAKLITRARLKNATVGAGVTSPFAIVSKGFRGIDAEVATGGQPRTRVYTLNVSTSL